MSFKVEPVPTPDYFLEKMRGGFGDAYVKSEEARALADAMHQQLVENQRYLFSLFPRSRELGELMHEMGIDPFTVPDNSQAIQQWNVRARGRQLDIAGVLYGIKRRWWGWEPDFLYRRRMRGAILGLK